MDGGFKLMSLPPYEFPWNPVPQVTPLTYRDGLTMLKKVDGIKKYINLVLVPWINENYSELAEEFATQAQAMVEQVNAALLAQDATVDTKIEELETYVDEQVALILGNSLAANDPMVAALLANPTSATRVQANSLYAIKSTETDLDTIEALVNSGRLSDATLKSTFQEVTDVATVAQGGSGRNTATAYGLIAAGTTATGVQQSVAPGTAGHFLVSGGGSALPQFTQVIDDTTAAANKVFSSNKVNAQIAAAHLAGTFAARPAATSVPAGTMYFCTNIPEMYRSDGTNWIVTGSGGNELGYAEQTALFSTTVTGPTDVPGFTTTVLVGVRPIRINVSMRLANQNVGSIAHGIVLLDGVEIGRLESSSPYADRWATFSWGRRITGLVAGTSHTIKVAISSPTGLGATGNARTAGDATNPNTLQVVTV